LSPSRALLPLVVVAADRAAQAELVAPVVAELAAAADLAAVAVVVVVAASVAVAAVSAVDRRGLAQPA
jgi:hypothetical protein